MEMFGRTLPTHLDQSSLQQNQLKNNTSCPIGVSEGAPVDFRSPRETDLPLLFKCPMWGRRSRSTRPESNKKTDAKRVADGPSGTLAWDLDISNEVDTPEDRGNLPKIVGKQHPAEPITTAARNGRASDTVKPQKYQRATRKHRPHTLSGGRESCTALRQAPTQVLCFVTP